MDKTYNDLMDIVNRTKKFDTNKKTLPTKPRTTRVIIEDEDSAPVEYDIETKPKRKTKSSSSLFAENSAIGSMLEKSSKKKATSTKSTAKKSTTSTTKKKTPAKPKTTKSAEEKDNLKPKAKTPAKTSPKPKPATTTSTIDTSDPKNAQLYEALRDTLFSGGTDISEYMKEDTEMSATQESLQELRAKREAQKINAEITKEQQEYEKLFTGSLGSLYQDEETTSDEDAEIKEPVDVAKKNAQLASELDQIRANLENKKNNPTMSVEREKRESDTTFELETGNKDLDKKIAEYYKRKQEKIDKYNAEEAEGIVEQDISTNTDNEPVDYEAIFGGSMISRDELMGVTPETSDTSTETSDTEEQTIDTKEQPVVSENIETVDTKEVNQEIIDNNTNTELVNTSSVASEHAEVENVNEVSEDVTENSIEDVEEKTEDNNNIVDNKNTEVVDEQTQKENREEHIKSLLSNLLYSKKEHEAEPVENPADNSEDISNEESTSHEENVTDDENTDYRQNDYASVWGSLSDDADNTEENITSGVEDEESTTTENIVSDEENVSHEENVSENTDVVEGENFVMTDAEPEPKEIVEYLDRSVVSVDKNSDTVEQEQPSTSEETLEDDLNEQETITIQHPVMVEDEDDDDDDFIVRKSTIAPDQNQTVSADADENQYNHTTESILSNNDVVEEDSSETIADETTEVIEEETAETIANETTEVDEDERAETIDNEIDEVVEDETADSVEDEREVVDYYNNVNAENDINENNIVTENVNTDITDVVDEEIEENNAEEVSEVVNDESYVTEDEQNTFVDVTENSSIDEDEDTSIEENENISNEEIIDDTNTIDTSINTTEEETNTKTDVYDLSDNAELDDYIVSSNIDVENNINYNVNDDINSDTSEQTYEENDEQVNSEVVDEEVESAETEPTEEEIEDTEQHQFDSVVENERIYEQSAKSSNIVFDDEEDDNTLVMNTLPENRVDLFGNEVPLDEDEEKEVEKNVEEKDDTISKEEFYNEMARLQENLINELKGNKVVTEGVDFFAEKDPKVSDEKVEEVVDKIIETIEEIDKKEEEESNNSEVETITEPVSPTEETIEVGSKAEPVDPAKFDDYNLLNKDVALNEEDLEFQEKSEEEKVTPQDNCFYLSPEDNEKKAVTDEYMTIYEEESSSSKEVGDINIFKNIGNATPSSEIIKSQPEEKNETSDAEIETIYTLMGIQKRTVSKEKNDIKVLYATSECQPFIASGGLADVAGSLPKAIANEGDIDIRVIMPLYGNIKAEYKDKFEYLGNFTVHLSWRQEYCGLFRYFKDGVTYYFIDNERYFKRDKLYGYYDDGERFAYFSKAIVESLPHLNFFPDIIHCNDWQSSLVSAYIKTGNWSDFRYHKIKNVYTIHNVEYQGVYGMENLKDLFGIDPRFRNEMDYNGDINLTKAAIQFCDKFTTVSDSYCDNLKQPYCSRGLHHIIIRNEYKLSGILNGIDYDFYNPATDTHIFKNYDLGCIEEKVLNKKLWQDEIGLPVDGDTPMIAIVSRLVNHKGIDLITKIIHNTLQQDIQFVVVGTGEQKYIDFFKQLEQRYPTKVRAFVDGYSNELARKAYAASDIFIMPSKIEPCGLSQMIASRYGSVPIVREVGGLKDSIRDFGCEGGGNGYTFTNYNPNDLQYQLDRAIRDYSNRTEWKEKMKACMTKDFTWKKPAVKYINLYKSLMGL